MRLTRVLAAALLFFASDMAIEAASGNLPEAAASKRTTVEVGDVLRATKDVELDEAVVRKGSKVSISRKSKAAGQVFLDVALADGHVVRAVPLSNIVKSFERVED